jgi:hypothetical protein
VMVNCDQTGQPAGLAVALAAKSAARVAPIDPTTLRRRLAADHGAVVI